MAKKRPPDSPFRYASLGIQLVAIIGIFTFAGIRLDKWQQTEKPWFTLGFSTFGVIVAITYLIRSFLKP